MRITYIPGDGIGSEISESVKQIVDLACSKLGKKIEWELVEAGAAMIEKHNTPLPDEVLTSILKNKVALKGPIETPIGKGFRSVNVTLRKTLNLYANVRPVKNIVGVDTPFSHVDIVVVRENTEDLYAGVEHMVGEDAAESIKIITRKASERICRYAFEYAVKHSRKKVTAVHKANIMKLSDGLFLDCARKIAAEFPQIQYDEKIVDALCMELVISPSKFDVLVCPNLYGDIVSDLCAGLVGGLGIVPGANIGTEASVFEAAHGSAPDLAGKNLANPTALLQSAIQMLHHIDFGDVATHIESALFTFYSTSKLRTKDLGGTLTTSEFTKEISSFI